MDDNREKETPTVKLSQVIQLLASQTKKEENTNRDELPTVMEVLEQWVTPGTLVKYPEKEIIFKNSPQSAVKSLKVNLCSMESTDEAILHSIHSETRRL